MNGMSLGTVWEAIYTAVVKTALELVDGTCLCVVAVYQVGFGAIDYSSFAFVSGMCNSRQMLGFVEFGFFPVKPF